MLWQYVKVLLGEDRLELHDVGGQRSSSGKCLLTASGSLRETLGGRSCGSEVDLSKFQEDACKEQLVSEPPVWATRLQRHFFELQLFLEKGRGSITTRSEGSEFSPLLVGLFLPQGMSSFTPEGATGHFNFSLFPVNLGVVVLEPVIA